MATDKEELAKIKRQMIALRNAIEDYVDGIDMDDADEKPAKQKAVKKDLEEKEDG